MHTKRLAQALGTAYGEPDKWWTNRNKGEVQYNRESVARVVVTEEDASTKIEWNNQLVASLGIDKARVQSDLDKSIANAKEVTRFS